MPKRIIKRFMPDHKTIREHKHLQLFGTLLHDPNLFHLNRRSVAGAFMVGLFVAFIPIPFQMLLAAAVAIVSRVNLPIAVTLVWVTNPVTMGPIFYFAYVLGSKILLVPTQNIQFEVTIDWMLTQLGAIWEPFLLGCLILATICALLGNLIIRGLWRLQVIKNWQTRKEQRWANRKSPKS
ncbi:MAG: DUF2062 domain-containing protein [Gammaproteobacteria bacterium]